jgi:hypothetical protein
LLSIGDCLEPVRAEAGKEAAMQSCVQTPVLLDPPTSAFYRHILDILTQAQLPFQVGGAYALNHYTGIVRHTKDLDIFVHPRDFQTTLQTLAGAGYRTETTFPHWLGKAFATDAFIDVIFGSGNGVAEVDDLWLAHGEKCEILEVPVQIAPVEEMIWSKSFVMERERFDGADISHLLLARGPQLNWDRLLLRFRAHWRILLVHLVLFGFAYPGKRNIVPNSLLDELIRRVHSEQAKPAPDVRLCQGTLLSREQYITDIEQWGYRDARLIPEGKMDSNDIAQWTAAIANKQ